jgi:shikimate kinase
MRPRRTRRNPSRENPYFRNTLEDRDGGILRVVLLGFMSSGKSAVGDALARRLEWGFLDFDLEIERREGRPVSVLVDQEGEEYLRELERALTREIREDRHLIVAPGGGWILQSDLLESIRPGTLSAWLKSSPAEIVRRLRTDPEGKPLADRPDAVEAVAEMLHEREPLYRLSDLSVPTDGRAVEEIAFEMEQLIRTRRIYT